MIVDLILLLSLLALDAWIIYRINVVYKYRIKLLRIDFDSYLSGDGYAQMVLNPVHYPVRKMKKVINGNS